MSHDSDSEEEEEFLVLTNFGNQLLEKDLKTSNIHIVGIDQQNPIAEVNGNLFKGTHDFAMGTYLFAAKDTESQPTEQSIYEKPSTEKFAYFGKTCKIINFERIYVDDKVVSGETGDNTEENPSHKEENDLRIDLTYEDAKKLLGKPTSTEKD